MFLRQASYTRFDKLLQNMQAQLVKSHNTNSNQALPEQKDLSYIAQLQQPQQQQLQQLPSQQPTSQSQSSVNNKNRQSLTNAYNADKNLDLIMENLNLNLNQKSVARKRDREWEKRLLCQQQQPSQALNPIYTQQNFSRNKSEKLLSPTVNNIESNHMNLELPSTSYFRPATSGGAVGYQNGRGGDSNIWPNVFFPSTSLYTDLQQRQNQHDVEYIYGTNNSKNASSSKNNYNKWNDKSKNANANRTKMKLVKDLQSLRLIPAQNTAGIISTSDYNELFNSCYGSGSSGNSSSSAGNNIDEVPSNHGENSRFMQVFS
jgi:hypothetical protein